MAERGWASSLASSVFPEAAHESSVPMSSWLPKGLCFQMPSHWRFDLNTEIVAKYEHLFCNIYVWHDVYAFLQGIGPDCLIHSSVHFFKNEVLLQLSRKVSLLPTVYEKSHEHILNITSALLFYQERVGETTLVLFYIILRPGKNKHFNLHFFSLCMVY